MNCIYTQYVRICSHNILTAHKEVHTTNDFIDFHNTWTKYEMSISIMYICTDLCMSIDWINSTPGHMEGIISKATALQNYWKCEAEFI